jgi:uncharacterized membrane protein
VHALGKSAMKIEVVCVALFVCLKERKFFDGLLLHQTLYWCGRKEIILIGKIFSSAIFATGKVVRPER